MSVLPDILSTAIADGTWRDPGAASLQRILGERYVDMKLYANEISMSHVKEQLDVSGCVEDPAFCLARGFVGHEDPRLAFDNALFVGGSIYPGDDVLITVDVGAEDLNLYILDWEPSRWRMWGTLAQFIDELSH